ncbi:MAG TPA: DUF3891 family protein [Verrucomicrobiota bacterium]|nr:DUF3891 family protein [Verrucomicrobiota bacterium]
MLRHETPAGWILIRHPDHAALAGEFAAAWGNAAFRPPEPRADGREGTRRHDDGWAARDAAPCVTRAGRPSAFGADLVGKYTAFEEIDLPDYLRVRGEALELVARENPYAAVLISMHTCNLLTEHADRATIRPDQLPLLDAFVAAQQRRQLGLRAAAAATGRFPDGDLSLPRLTEHFRLLQACDNLSLLACVDHPGPATLLHPLPRHDGGASGVRVTRSDTRTFRLDPWPFRATRLEFQVTGRPVVGHVFPDHGALRAAYHAARPVPLAVTLTA